MNTSTHKHLNTLNQCHTQNAQQHNHFTKTAKPSIVPLCIGTNKPRDQPRQRYKQQHHKVNNIQLYINLINDHHRYRKEKDQQV